MNRVCENPDLVGLPPIRPDRELPERIVHPREPRGNAVRALVQQLEPKTQRTYTPTLAVLSKSAGVFHWTPDGRQLYDFTSGVLVANLGHNPELWLERFWHYLGWSLPPRPGTQPDGSPTDHFRLAAPLTAYNAMTELEAEASRRLLELVRSRPGGKRLEQVLWAASGSEAIIKALWAALARDRHRDVILATRYGFHGKKGLAGATTGCETDRERDPRVRFISFPMNECRDVTLRDQPFDPTPYQRELDALIAQYGRRITALITEPYLGGGGSYHPPKAYLQLLQQYCREHDWVLILDEVQSAFGRTGKWFAFEQYELEPDIVVLGKGLANGVPGAVAVGRADLFAALDYAEGSDTYSGNPLTCAGVLATLDCYAAQDILGNVRQVSPIIEEGLVRLKDLPFVGYVRGERGGMVWGVEMWDWAGRSASDWANAFVLECYLGDGPTGIHLLGPLAKKVIRIAPPLVITPEQAHTAMGLMYRWASRLLQACTVCP
ncbi:MAG: aminotransferase class III-fold pyridoxal phosphate-dependent enzyme [Gemmatales bacterium]|nr:aminotransferase class III-fold pyridoxal phosphate-dependent enzyme [Gemmatales bacterium]MDW7993889.1 aminotransferase class III-fold pyridoxal phosphate-dependent enzyme [Gemmatales bacterium]